MHFKKVDLPVEHLRSLKYKKSSSLGCFKYLSMSIHTLLRTIPMPWEDNKEVHVLYHINGNISFILDKTKYSKYEFECNWEEVNKNVRNFKMNNPDYQVLNYPIYDDDYEITYEFSHLDNFINNSLINDNFINNNLIVENNSFINDSLIPNNTPILNNTPIPNNTLLHNNNTILNNTPIHNNIPIHNNNAIQEKNEKYLDYLKINKFKRRKKLEIFNNYDISIYGQNISECGINLHNLNKIKNNKPKTRKSHTNILRLLKNTRFFQTTKMNWVESAVFIIKQGHNMLTEILRRKKIFYLILDNNFNLKPIRPLKTKERKKSRVGTSFHLTRELLKIMKFIVDIFLKLGNKKNELCINLHNLFTKIGVITGIYRYKYKVMKQIKICKDIEKILKYYDDVTWTEIWRRYVFMTRGYNSLLKNYNSNLIERLINGREYREKKETKQRIESNYDMYIKNNMIEELKDFYNKEQIKMIFRHFNESWRCWKGDIPYNINIEKDNISNTTIHNMSNTEIVNISNTTIHNISNINMNNTYMNNISNINMNNTYMNNLNEYYCNIINKYINVKSQWYIKQVITPKIDSKKAFTKHIGKMTRLWYKEEKFRQTSYLLEMSISPLEAAGLYTATYEYFNNKKKILFPYKNSERHLQNAISILQSHASEEEKDYYNKILINPSNTIYQIQKNILTQRKFRDVEAKISYNYNNYNIIYKVNYIERLTDGFLASYLNYESEEIFPKYIKPGDEMEIQTIYNVFNTIKKNVNDNIAIIEGEYKDLMKNIDNNLLNRLLKIFIDPSIVDYVISRNNIKLYYKDMSFVNHIGFICGFQFSPFIYKFYSFVIDLVVFGNDILIRNLDKFYILQTNSKDTPLEEIKYEYMTRLPVNIGKIVNINISHNKFTYAGIEVFFKDKTPVMKLGDEIIKNLEFRIKQIIKFSGSSTFIKTISKWNNTILGFVVRYRDIIDNTPEIYNLLIKSEKSIQKIIKQGINSKMPIRFPPVLFYTPVDYGGLGMYSVIKNGSNNEEFFIPSLLDYVPSWNDELIESKEVWSEFVKSEKIVPEKGIPRMSTLLQKDKLSYYDRDWRLQVQFNKFISSKYDPFIFTNLKHDGKLYDLSSYKEDVINSLGGINEILRHTLYYATNAKEFNKIFWNESLSNKNMTKAQKSGLSKIPNRRYILWWSPTINTSDVYVGYQVQLNSTGIFMHGKLPTLKISYLQIFRNNLWKKIHENILDDLKILLSKYCDTKIEKDKLILEGNFYIKNENIKNIIIILELRWGSYNKHDSSKYAKVIYTTSDINNKVVIVFDLCYNNCSYYGDFVTNINLQDIIMKILKNNISLNILRERIRKTLEIYTSDVENIVSSKEMYYNTLIIENEFLFNKNILIIFEPEIGNVYLEKIQGNYKKIRNEIGIQILEMSRLLKRENLLIRKDFYSIIESYLIDYKEIKIKIYENNINLTNILKMTHSDVINNKMIYGGKICINLYKNWFGISNFTKFCRLVLILQAYDIINGISFNTILSDKEWIKIEKDCKDFIINKYCSEKLINKHKLLNTDIRDIIFGFDNEEYLKYKGITWEEKYLIMDQFLNEKKYKKINNLDKSKVVRNDESDCKSVFINLNIIKIFKRCIDINTISFSFLVEENDCLSIAFIPQFSTEDEIHSCRDVPNINIIGIIINTEINHFIEKIVERYKIKDPLIINVTEEIKINKSCKITKQEGFVYSPCKWNYNLDKKNYYDNMKYKLELGIPNEFYSGYNYHEMFKRL